MEKGKITTALAPAWFPDDYELVDITVEQTPFQKAYRAQYIRGEQELIITVREYLNDEPLYVEQSEGFVEEYKVDGITYYLLENNKQLQTVWIVDSFECSITGSVTIEEIKLMIDSITKG